MQDWAPGAVHGGQYDAVVGRDATFKQVVVTLGGDLVRLVSNVQYAGPGGSADLFGVYFADETQHQEHRLWVDHAVPNCRSNVKYKGALQGEDARTVWIGDVRIRPAATGTDTYELNRNLVLTDGARADSVPNLEIETGEIVGAGHASATGRFDDEQLFYLCSRGIDAETARRLVVRGFFADVVQEIGLPELQDRLMGTIEARLGALPGPGGAGGRGMSFERVCALSDVEEPGSLRVELDDVDIAVVRFEGEVYAIEDLCSHAEVPAVRGRRRGVQGRPDHRVLAARVVLRPAHRRTHQPAGHRAGVRLPGPRGGGGRVRRRIDRRQPPRRGQQLRSTSVRPGDPRPARHRRGG